MNDLPLAHISEDGLKTQTLDDHLAHTAELAGDLAASFGCRPQAVFIGELHDVGKSSKEFKARLNGGPPVDHSTAGAYEAATRHAVWAAECIAGHHGGLPDMGVPGPSDIDPSTLVGRLNRAHKGLIPAYTPPMYDVTVPKPPHGLGECDMFDDMAIIRMLFSCLVDADYLDTERFMNGGKPRAHRSEDLSAIKDRFAAYTVKWNSPRTKLDKIRTDILSACVSQAALPKGLFTLTVPTGGGKTTASFGFAVNHAVDHGMDRVIYVIPFTSVIDQTAAVFAGAVGEANVLAHHSEAISELYDEMTPANRAKLLAAENWDSPVVVTTAVRFFESLFAARPSTCRKLHSIANSIVIFDEAQTLPPEQLEPCCAAIAMLIKHFGCSVVLSTATQPAIIPTIQKYAGNVSPTELCRDITVQNSNVPYDLKTELRRCDIVNKGKLYEDELACELKARDNVLCIVNSRETALRLFAKLPDEGSYCLSTLMYPEHRRRITDEIKQRLKDGLTCRVVSTSVIEAGVDVDFETVYRELTGIDSIIQSAGRCNRESVRPADKSHTYVFELYENENTLRDARKNAATMALYGRDLTDVQPVLDKYFKLILELKHDHDADRVFEMSHRGYKGAPYPFRTVAERFRMISGRARNVYVVTPESADMIAHIEDGSAEPFEYRRINRFAASVPETAFKRMLRNGDIKLIPDTDAAILKNPGLYSEKAGLSIIDPAS